MSLHEIRSAHTLCILLLFVLLLFVLLLRLRLLASRSLNSQEFAANGGGQISTHAHVVLPIWPERSNNKSNLDNEKDINQVLFHRLFLSFRLRYSTTRPAPIPRGSGHLVLSLEFHQVPIMSISLKN